MLLTRFIWADYSLVAILVKQQRRGTGVLDTKSYDVDCDQKIPRAMRCVEKLGSHHAGRANRRHYPYAEIFQLFLFICTNRECTVGEQSPRVMWERTIFRKTMSERCFDGRSGWDHTISVADIFRGCVLLFTFDTCV